MNEKIYIDWHEFHTHVKTLAEKLKSKEHKFNRIIAVSRGGLIPAGILAYEMNIRNCETINFSSYDDDYMRADEEIEIKNELFSVDSQTLIIDDLADSGRTLKILRKHYPDAYIACVYAKPKGIEAADCFVQDLPDKWVVFPWD